jgi:hypothetical protein
MGKKDYEVVMARILHVDGTNIQMEVYTDNEKEIYVNDGDEFITVALKVEQLDVYRHKNGT